jgi:hypothetical protein
VNVCVCGWVCVCYVCVSFCVCYVCVYVCLDVGVGVCVLDVCVWVYVFLCGCMNVFDGESMCGGVWLYICG